MAWMECVGLDWSRHEESGPRSRVRVREVDPARVRNVGPGKNACLADLFDGMNPAIYTSKRQITHTTYLNATTATLAAPYVNGTTTAESVLSGLFTPGFRGTAGNWAFAREDELQTRKQLRVAEEGVLVAAAAGGDRRAFRELMDRYIDDVSRTVAGMLGAGQEVDDIVQDAFIRLYRALPTFRGDASVKTYVTRIAINRSLDEIRARKRRRWLRPWEEVDGRNELAGEQIASDDAETSDRDRLLRHAVDTLPAAQRAVVVLRMIEEYSTEETADILGIAYGTVLSRLKRGLDKLKETLSESGYTSMSDV